ncbi:MAG: hypothetical protein HY795_03780 [Desulfovibrio sp.]|nr:hypothetical protein [Desulfovibrio sp.]MBI4957918.1 hypothetical protein [Desulfovibrio sp.]
MIRTTILASLILAAACHAALAATFTHTIDASFDPAARKLTVTDTLFIPEGAPEKLILTLSPRAAGFQVLAGTSPVRFKRSGEAVELGRPKNTAELVIRYALPLDAPPKSLPATQDNPGALASDAAAGPDWAMLMPGSLWHPEVQSDQNTYVIRLIAPPGIKAVTQGELKGFSEGTAGTASSWSVQRPLGRLGLCLARYTFEESRDSPVPVQTFLLEANRQLASVYLAASARHLRFYQDLHGPYPLEKFAVVENPLPTGYGFPSYTLLGSQVLALPFIPETSLRHEIAHDWWGNGVLVDFAQGNWCEGLTTYVADYLAQAEASPKAGRAYRIKTLRAFADLVRQGGDLPLERFGSRFSPASQAVGYGKALFVFHMLRGFVGDEAFWQGLRRIYTDKLFKPASWEDFRRVFAGLEGFDEATSLTFFKQWITRTGGPKLSITRAESATNPSGGYLVRVTIAQEGQPYLLKLSLRVDTDVGPMERSLILDGSEMEIALDVPGKPTRLTLDPGADCFRLLDPAEVAPTVNSVKGVQKLTVIVADSAGDRLRQALPTLLAGLGQEGAKVVEERDIAPGSIASYAKEGLLVVGHPRLDIPGLHDVLPQTQDADTVFAALPRTGGFTSVFQARPEAKPQDVNTAASKVTHYGSFSLLGFKTGRNVAKETLDAPGSPLVKEF